MALFKSMRGKRKNLPTTKTDGYAYFCTDDGTFWIDYKDDNDILQRKQLNAKDAETLMGCSISKIINNSELEIPISSAVFNELATKVPTSRTVNGKALSSNITLSSSDVSAAPASHASDKTIHITNDERNAWNAKLDSYTETDPTVPAWAKAKSKPSYTASEVGAVPTSRTVNGKALSANITLAASDVGAATMNEVNAAIQTAIGNAIGGSY